MNVHKPTSYEGLDFPITPRSEGDQHQNNTGTTDLLGRSSKFRGYFSAVMFQTQ